jgi:uncharacterized membrane protein
MPTWMWIVGLGVPAAAAAVPVIIHLINLTRYRKVDWAAMEFLLAAYKRTRRRMQMENLIMLLLRIAAVVLIAAALFPMGCQELRAWAGDGLGASRVLTSDAPMHMVLVLDNSGSKAYRQENITAFDRARQFAVSAVDSLQDGRDRVSIILLSDVYVPPTLGGAAPDDDEVSDSRRRRISQLSNLNLEAARRELAAVNVAPVDTNMLAALREALRLADSTPGNTAVGLVVISDFFESGWGEMMPERAVHAELLTVMERLQTRMAENGTRPLLYDAAFENATNVAVTDVRVDERVIGDGLDLRVFVELSYSAATARAQPRSVRLRYRIDGGAERPFLGPINIGPNTVISDISMPIPAAELALRPEEARTGGSRNIEIFTEEPDALPGDNSRHLVVQIVPGVPVLVVNGQPHRDVDRDETFYLETALGISSSRVEGERGDEPDVRITPNQVMSVRVDDLASFANFFDFRLVILANVRELSDSTVEKLEDYVRAGYGLMIFDGPRVDHQLYNQSLYRNGEGLLPVRLGTPAGSDDRVSAPRHRMTIGAESHRVLRIFTESDETRSILIDPEAVFNWRSVELPEGTEADSRRPVDVLIGLNTPEETVPLLVERPFGRGRVIYMATTTSPTWHDLWVQGGFPLWLNLEIVNYLTGHEARYSNLAVGEPYRRVLRARDIAPQYMVRDPAGTSVELLPMSDDDLQYLEFGGTAQAGVYTVTAQQRGDGGELVRLWQERFAVNIPAREANVARIRPSEQSEAAEANVGAALTAAMPDINFTYLRAGEEADGGGSLLGEDEGRDWMWLAVLGVMFLVFEMFWSGVISKPDE